MKTRVCDLCEERTPDAKIKYRYKAKRRWFLWFEEGWDRIELCQDCLEEIINTKEVKQYGIKHNEPLFFEHEGKRYKVSTREIKKSGAIEFLKAWHDVCKERENCHKCPVVKYCKCTVIGDLTDKNITELVRSVMAQSRKAEK